MIWMNNFQGAANSVAGASNFASPGFKLQPYGVNSRILPTSNRTSKKTAGSSEFKDTVGSQGVLEDFYSSRAQLDPSKNSRVEDYFSQKIEDAETVEDKQKYVDEYSKTISDRTAQYYSLMANKPLIEEDYANIKKTASDYAEKGIADNAVLTRGLEGSFSANDIINGEPLFQLRIENGQEKVLSNMGYISEYDKDKNRLRLDKSNNRFVFDRFQSPVSTSGSKDFYKDATALFSGLGSTSKEYLNGVELNMEEVNDAKTGIGYFTQTVSGNRDNAQKVINASWNMLPDESKNYVLGLVASNFPTSTKKANYKHSVYLNKVGEFSKEKENMNEAQMAEAEKGIKKASIEATEAYDDLLTKSKQYVAAIATGKASGIIDFKSSFSIHKDSDIKEKSKADKQKLTDRELYTQVNRQEGENYILGRSKEGDPNKFTRKAYNVSTYEIPENVAIGALVGKEKSSAFFSQDEGLKKEINLTDVSSGVVMINGIALNRANIPNKENLKIVGTTGIGMSMPTFNRGKSTADKGDMITDSFKMEIAKNEDGTPKKENGEIQKQNVYGEYYEVIVEADENYQLPVQIAGEVVYKEIGDIDDSRAIESIGLEEVDSKYRFKMQIPVPSTYTSTATVNNNLTEQNARAGAEENYNQSVANESKGLVDDEEEQKIAAFEKEQALKIAESNNPKLKKAEIDSLISNVKPGQLYAIGKSNNVITWESEDDNKSMLGKIFNDNGETPSNFIDQVSVVKKYVPKSSRLRGLLIDELKEDIYRKPNNKRKTNR